MVLQDQNFINTRQKFMRKFLDVSSDILHGNYFNDRILKTVDGLLHTGYFWDLFKNPMVIDEKFVFDFLASLSNDIYILWDNNIFNQKINYPIFSGLEVLPQELGDLLSTLPSDIYLFDETFKWAFALTHEDVNDKRYCVACFNK